MLRKTSFSIAAIAAVVLFSSGPNLQSFGQESPTEEETTLTTAAPAQGSAFIIVCDSSPNQVIVLDSQGKWLPTVRSAKVEIEIGKPASITCVMWSGQFKPSNPETRTWTLSQMKSVNAQQFQTYVDQLQTNPNAIAQGMTGNSGGNEE